MREMILLARWLQSTTVHRFTPEITTKLVGKKIMSRISAIAVFTLVFGISSWSSSLTADQFVARHGSREVVVHTNPVPVFLHRLVPPNYGRHITLQEYHARRGKASSRIGK
jgi:hypothetical protein